MLEDQGHITKQSSVWRILLEQTFIDSMTSLMATSAFGLLQRLVIQPCSLPLQPSDVHIMQALARDSLGESESVFI